MSAACRTFLFATLLGVNLACSGPKEVQSEPFDFGVRRDAGPVTGDGGDPTDFGFVDGAPVDGGPADTGDGDGAVSDAQPGDATVDDRGNLDGDIPDAPIDMGPVDLGPDAGQLADTGPNDTGPGDTGPGDTGVFPDAGNDGGVNLPSGYTPNTIDQTFRHGQSVELVDLDGNNRLDIVGSISLTDTVRLYLNGAAGFTQVSVAPNNSVVAMDTAMGDIDGDNDLDIAVVGLFDRVAPFTSPGEVMWFENPGVPTGTWIRHDIVAPNFYGPLTVEMGDLDGNGQPDLVIGAIEIYDINGDAQGNGVHWLRNNAGTFTAPIAIDATITGVEEVKVLDVDGDGVDDVVASSLFQNVVRWYENPRIAGQVLAQPTFTNHLLANLNSPLGFTITQLDADPGLELVVQHDNGAGGAVVRLDAPANPTQVWAPTVIDATFGGPDSRRLVAHGDLNNDGLTDLVVCSFGNGLVRSYLQGPNQTFVSQAVVTLPGVDGLRVGDIDGDDRDDIVVSTYDNGATDSIIWYRSLP